MLRSLRAQLSLTILLILLLSVALISVLSNWLINREFEGYIARQEKERSENIVSDLGNLYSQELQGWDPHLLHTIGMYSLYDGYILKIYGQSGALLWDAENHDMTLCSQIMEEISLRMEAAKKQGDFVTHSYDINKAGAFLGSVSITYYGPFFFTENDYLFIKTLNAILLAVGLLSVAFAVLAGGLMARRITRPVAKTAYIAEQIAKGNYNIRFEGEPHARELGDMVRAIDRLSMALSEQESLRKRLTADVAHELRTPLSAVSSHLEAMTLGVWEPTPQRLQSCREEIVRLGILVEDLERLASIEDGSLKLNKARIDLHALAQTALHNLALQARGKGLALSLAGPPVYVEADRERIMQVLMNLLSNAIHYTPQGGAIRVETSETAQSGRLCVQDTGIGISEAELPFIFERFYRTDKSRNRKTGGAGIGLAIAKSIAEAHGGSINVTSRAQKGSAFTLALPKQSG